MEIRNILVVLLLVVGIAFGNVCQGRNLSQQFDWNGATAVDSKKMSELTCNKDTQIDFNFPQAATGNLAVTVISTSGHLQYEFVSF
jgi:cytochrome c oxidase assembly protein Cox11